MGAAGCIFDETAHELLFWKHAAARRAAATGIVGHLGLHWMARSVGAILGQFASKALLGVLSDRVHPVNTDSRLWCGAAVEIRLEE